MNKRSKQNQEALFLSPDPLLKNQQVSPSLSFRVLNQILPLKFLISGLAFSFTLFLIPIGTLFLGGWLFGSTYSLLPILISSSLFFCFYSMVLGFLLMNMRIPFLKEWKDKLGFHEV
ncbi:hypothetical protein [Leptospira idonii]|uniref:Uncharacterized protein n=1 Tax=Leptospira idonii TaxID=1193500 RepID=A0A4R9LWF7_9LEPT|nr:hypothetical protein [Leptospira idonii]TGN17159.1 hypothetical protein EHS15_18475 [Leptospira idonii]